MKREFTDESFEAFLKRNADNLRMKAPEKVWQHLSTDLNKSRRKLTTGLSAIFLTTCILASLTTSNTNQNTPLRHQAAHLDTPAASATASSDAAHGRIIKTGLAAGPSTVSKPSGLLNLLVERRVLPTHLSALGDRQNQVGAGYTSLVNQPASLAAVTPLMDDDMTPTLRTPAQQNTEKSLPTAFAATDNAWPLSIESVVNTYRKKASRFQTEFHFTPTISYRKLSENKAYLRATPMFNPTSNYAAFYSSVNNMVTHKPDIGFELGVTEKYSLTQKLRIKAGLQFNVNRYDIKAFKAPYSLATIALNTRGSSRVDSVWTLSSYSNVDASSNKSSWLQNLSFQVSAPVGVELTLKGNDKMQFGIATTVQPTYVLGDRAYLITTDYKSYTQVPWLLRRWNVNTAFETFVSYKSGKARWQVGPQVRYQLLSSFITNYPVKENLFDFGLKIGVSVNK